jgi:hypothetical protein
MTKQIQNLKFSRDAGFETLLGKPASNTRFQSTREAAKEWQAI